MPDSVEDAMMGNHSLEKQVAHVLRENGLARSNKTLIVGVSGGPDSTALLATLIATREALSVSLHVVHVNHGLRPEGRGDAAYVRRLCRQRGVPLTIKRADVEGLRQRRKLSLEEAARQARYAAFATVARETRADAILLAHTANDQVETILLNLLRGAGLHGLSGMETTSPIPPVPGEIAPPPISLVRPFLETERSEIEAYLRAQRLRPRLDASNLSPDFLRNRVRHELVPLMDALRSGASDAILRTAAAAHSVMDYLASQTAEAWEGVCTRREEDAVYLRLTSMRDLHPALQTGVLQRSVEALVGSLEGWSYRHWDAMATLLRQGVTGDSLNLPHHLVLTLLSGEAALSKGPLPCPLPRVDEHVIVIPGKTQAGGWTFDAREAEEEPLLMLVATTGEPLRDESTLLDGPFGITFERPFPDGLAVRSRRPGDRIRLPGGERKVQDVLTDAHVPRSWRDSIPIVYDVDSGAIVWIVGVAAGVGMHAYSPEALKTSTMPV